MDRTSKGKVAADWSPFIEPIEANTNGKDEAATAPEAVFVWRGSLPWQIFTEEVVFEALRVSGVAPNRAAALASDASGKSLQEMYRRRRNRHLIEWNALVDLTSACLFHSGLWRFRVTSIQAESALNRLIELLQEPRYELAITSRPIAFNMTLHACHSIALWEFMGKSGTPFNSTLIRCPEMIQTFAGHIDDLWQDDATTCIRSDVIRLLRERLAALKNHMIL